MNFRDLFPFKYLEYVNATSHLSIAEIAAQRTAQTGVKVTPREVFVEEIEKFGATKGIDMYKTLGFQMHPQGYSYAGEKNAELGISIFCFKLPYTAITPALIKAVCGGAND